MSSPKPSVAKLVNCCKFAWSLLKTPSVVNIDLKGKTMKKI